MTPVTAVQETPSQDGETAPPSAPPTEHSDADAELLAGLGALADLIHDASDTLNQCILTIEGKLCAVPVTEEAWIPITTARSAVERPAPAFEEQASQERVFGGVPVTIMRFGAPAPQPEAGPRCEWQYEVGYATTDTGWALMIRTVSVDHSNQRGASPEFSDLMMLRDAPLEIRLKAIREIPDLIQVLASRTCEEPGVEAAAPSSDSQEHPQTDQNDEPDEAIHAVS